jgi:hypothetical protein
MVTTTQKTNSINNGTVKLTGSGASVYADSSPIPTADINDRDGWLFTKTSGAEKFNYYFYGQGNNAITLSHLNNVFFTGSIDNYISGASAPFVVIYTKPTGIGDAGAWYHSKVAYALHNTEDIQIGEMCLFRCIGEVEDIPITYRQVRLLTKITTGTALGNEEILTISIQSDSGSADTTQILISNVGFQAQRGNDKISRNIKLTV